METTLSEQLMPPHLLAQKYHDAYYETRLNELANKEKMINKRLLCAIGIVVLIFSIYIVSESYKKSEKEK